MQILGTYNQLGFTIEVFDPAGFIMESDEYGNRERYSADRVDPDHPNAMTLQELETLCGEIAEEKAYSLGLPTSVVEIECDDD